MSGGNNADRDTIGRGLTASRRTRPDFCAAEALERRVLLSGGGGAATASSAATGGAGTLDRAFGNGGQEVLGFPTSASDFAVAVSAGGGKVVVAGATNGNTPALARFNAADGRLDPSFGTGGEVQADLVGNIGVLEGADSAVRAVAIDASGKVVVAVVGQEVDAGDYVPFVDLVRRRADGSRDASFGPVHWTFNTDTQFDHVELFPVTGGGVLLDVAGLDAGSSPFGFVSRFDAAGRPRGFPTAEAVAAAAPLGDGRVLTVEFPVAVDESVEPGPLVGTLKRYRADGTPDPTFARGRGVSTGLSDAASIQVAALSNGRAVVGGYPAPAEFGDGQRFVLKEFNANGTPDTRFGSRGVVETGLDSPDFGTLSPRLLAQPQGRVLVLGAKGDRPALVRYNADGTLDKSFGSVGTLFLPAGVSPAGLAVGPGDSILVAATVPGVERPGGAIAPADFGLLRYTAAGQLDTSFGAPRAGGVARADFLYKSGEVRAAARSPDGKILVLMRDDAESFVARLNPDGSLDRTFGQGGLVFANGGPSSVPNEPAAVAVQADGKVLVAASFDEQTETGDFNSVSTITRFNVDGSPDGGFGTRGTVKLGAPTARLLIQPDGKILAAGGLALARFNTNGTPDRSFGTAGSVATMSGTPAEALALGRDGRIVVAGAAFLGSDSGGGESPTVSYANFAVARYDARGRPDHTFGQGVRVQAGTLVGTDFVPRVPDVAVLPDGSVVALGQGDGLYLAKFNPAGRLDTRFGQKGIVKSGGFGAGQAMIATPDGKFVVGGTLNSPGFRLLRFNANGSPDLAFGRGAAEVVLGPLPANPTTDVLDDVNLAALLLGPGGTVVAVGSVDVPLVGSRLAAARFRVR
jgi:uncharacterized delta-60 repeat protein